QALGGLKNKDGLVCFPVPTVEGLSMQLHVGPDKSPCQIRTKIQGKRFLASPRETLPEGKFFDRGSGRVRNLSGTSDELLHMQREVNLGPLRRQRPGKASSPRRGTLVRYFAGRGGMALEKADYLRRRDLPRTFAATQEAHQSEQQVEVSTRGIAPRSWVFCSFYDRADGRRKGGAADVAPLPGAAVRAAKTFVHARGRSLKVIAKTADTELRQRNIHSHDISQRQIQAIMKAPTTDVAWAQAAPSRRLFIIAGDMNFAAFARLDLRQPTRQLPRRQHSSSKCHIVRWYQ
ncbi:unnamed protein product, partial [Prorocentrum cordatum]